MIFNIPLHEPPTPDTWKKRFAWRPTRIGPNHVVWLESYEYRVHIVDEGNWASGPVIQLEYRYPVLQADPGGVWYEYGTWMEPRS